MKVSDIVNPLREGKTIRQVAQLTGISFSTIRRKLDELNYSFKSNQWIWEGEGMEPLETEIPIRHAVKSEPLKIHKMESPKVHTNTPRTQNEIHTVFTSEEVSILKDMINSWKKEPKDPLFDRAASLPRGGKDRRTIVIGSETSQAFDEFAKRFPACTKSDLVELALLDLIAKYTND